MKCYLKFEKENVNEKENIYRISILINQQQNIM